MIESSSTKLSTSHSMEADETPNEESEKKLEKISEPKKCEPESSTSLTRKAPTPREKSFVISIVDKSVERPWIRKPKFSDPKAPVFLETIREGNRMRKLYNDMIANSKASDPPVSLNTIDLRRVLAQRAHERQQAKASKNLINMVKALEKKANSRSSHHTKRVHKRRKSKGKATDQTHVSRTQGGGDKVPSPKPSRQSTEESESDTTSSLSSSSDQSPDTSPVSDSNFPTCLIRPELVSRPPPGFENFTLPLHWYGKEDKASGKGSTTNNENSQQSPQSPEESDGGGDADADNINPLSSDYDVEAAFLTMIASHHGVTSVKNQGTPWGQSSQEVISKRLELPKSSPQQLRTFSNVNHHGFQLHAPIIPNLWSSGVHFLPRTTAAVTPYNTAVVGYAPRNSYVAGYLAQTRWPVSRTIVKPTFHHPTIRLTQAPRVQGYLHFPQRHHGQVYALEQGQSFNNSSGNGNNGSSSSSSSSSAHSNATSNNNSNAGSNNSNSCGNSTRSNNVLFGVSRNNNGGTFGTLHRVTTTSNTPTAFLAFPGYTSHQVKSAQFGYNGLHALHPQNHNLLQSPPFYPIAPNATNGSAGTPVFRPYQMALQGPTYLLQPGCGLIRAQSGTWSDVPYSLQPNNVAGIQKSSSNGNLRGNFSRKDDYLSDAEILHRRKLISSESCDSLLEETKQQMIDVRRRGTPYGLSHSLDSDLDSKNNQDDHDETSKTV